MRMLLIELFMLSLFSSCKEAHEHDNSDNDTTHPVLIINKPSEHQVFQNGDTVWIQGTLTDNELHELQIDILRDSDTADLYHEVISVHDLTSYTIRSFWKSNVSDTTDATLVLKAWDHKPNVTEKRIPVRINK